MDSSKDAQHQTKEIVSPSLIKTPPPDVNWSDYRKFDLGLDPEWQWLTAAVENSVENDAPELQGEQHTKKPRLSLSLKKANKASHSEDRDVRGAAKNITNIKPHNSAGMQNRFASPVSDNQLKKAASGVVPENTRCNTNWAERNFINWAKQRNQQVLKEPIPLDLLLSHDAELVCKTLCKFILETHNSSGQPYPPASIRALLSAINRIFRENKAPFSIFNKDDAQFHDLHCTMDSVSSELHRKGIGTEYKHASLLTIEDEDALWAAGSLGTSTPLCLQHTVFFMWGSSFASKVFKNTTTWYHSSFPADTSIYDNSVYYQCIEFVSKNNQHRFKDIDATNKQVRTYALAGSDQ